MVGVLLLLVCGCSLQSHAAQQSLEGDWVGTLKLEDRQDRVDVHFRVEQGSVKGAVDLPLRGQMGLALSSVRLDSPRVSFEWQEKSGGVTFNGRLADGAMSGEVRQGEAQGTLQLVRIARVD
ncbi:MAG TPA: hypothetical protein VG148_15885, partial [Pyrinomonadaceae bacterium]|nr:hypothetical protein [Pyrinomonadaceae bacterium]